MGADTVICVLLLLAFFSIACSGKLIMNAPKSIRECSLGGRLKVWAQATACGRMLQPEGVGASHGLWAYATAWTHMGWSAESLGTGWSFSGHQNSFLATFYLSLKNTACQPAGQAQCSCLCHVSTHPPTNNGSLKVIIYQHIISREFRKEPRT